MKHILLAISGLTPQIVTETLFALAVQKDISIDEIYIITTKRGKLVISGKDKHPNTPNVSLRKEIENLCKDYKIKKPKFTKSNIIVAEEETRELYDIKTDKENKLFPNKLAEIFNKLTSNPDTVIHASLSGGRKSMSAHLALVMSLFARSQDKLYHVITDEKYEFQNFYPKTREEEKALVLAEVPFVRLRCVNDPLLKPNTKYSDIVEKTQKKLKYLTDQRKLIISLADKKVIYGDKHIILEPVEMVLYFKFVDRKISQNKGYKIDEINYNKEFARELKDILETKYHLIFDNRDKEHWHIKGMKAEIFRTKRSKINNKLRPLFEDEETFDEFKINSKRVWGETRYFIKANKDKLGINIE